MTPTPSLREAIAAAILASFQDQRTFPGGAFSDFDPATQAQFGQYADRILALVTPSSPAPGLREAVEKERAKRRRYSDALADEFGDNAESVKAQTGFIAGLNWVLALLDTQGGPGVPTGIVEMIKNQKPLEPGFGIPPEKRFDLYTEGAGSLQGSSMDAQVRDALESLRISGVYCRGCGERVEMPHKAQCRYLIVKAALDCSALGRAGSKTPLTEPGDADLQLFGWAPGGYSCWCLSCRKMHQDSDKRSLVCRPCAVQRFKAPPARLDLDAIRKDLEGHLDPAFVRDCIMPHLVASQGSGERGKG